MLVTKDMVDIMKPGSVLVDLAAEAGVCVWGGGMGGAAPRGRPSA